MTLAVRGKLPTRAALKTEYARALAQIGKAPVNTRSKPRIVSGGPFLRIARARRLVDNSVNAFHYSRASRALAIRGMQHGLLLLRCLHAPLSDLCDLLTTDILVYPSARVQIGGGSSSNLLGTAWHVPSNDLTSIDIAESVVHEMVHMNLHLADMTFGLYTHAPGSDFQAHSAVLRRPRPHYLAFHSACVAVAMIYFRLLLGLQIATLRTSLRRCTAELLDHRAAFTRYAWTAIVAAHAFARAPRLSVIPVHRDVTRLR